VKREYPFRHWLEVLYEADELVAVAVPAEALDCLHLHPYLQGRELAVFA
jgi:hypothetical protein